MQLSLNGWPPVASHVTCILVGMSIAHLSRGAPEQRLRMPPKSVAIAMPPGSVGANLARGSKVYLVKTSDDGPTCRLSRAQLTVLDPTAVLTLPLSEAPSLSTAWPGLRNAKGSASGVMTADARTSETLPLCRANAKVVYGGR